MTEPEWPLPGDNACANLARGVMSTIQDICSKFYPDLLDDFPFRRPVAFNAAKGEGWIAIHVRDQSPAATMMFGGWWQPDHPRLNELKSKVLPFESRSYQDLKNCVGETWFSPTEFLYVGRYEHESADYRDLMAHVAEWLNDLVLPKLIELNRVRVLRAIPSPPSYDTGRIAKALWILEGPTKQGTAFALEGIGVVTCDHVLEPNIRAFQSQDRSRRYTVEVLARDADTDLALVAVVGASLHSLPWQSADRVNLMDHVLVAGFPNQNFGDSGFFVPGVVVGFRTRRGLRLIMTNAPIVTGTSGGPVIDASQRVIGIAAVGSPSFSTAQTNEDHGIIPIDAVRFLLKS